MGGLKVPFVRKEGTSDSRRLVDTMNGERRTTESLTAHNKKGGSDI